MLISKKLLTVAALSVAALSANAATYYVSTTGSDTAAGSLSAPWKTIRKGMTTLRAGDTLYVRGGTYQERLGGSTPIRIYPGTATAGITVKNYPGERPVLQGLLWLSRPSYWTLDGLNVTWQDGQPSTYHMVKLVNGVGWKVTNAEIWGAKSYANVLVANTVQYEPSNWQITNCTIHDTIKSNNTNQDQLIYCNVGTSAGKGLIERNLLFNALNGMGIKIGGPDPNYGSANVTVRYNTIYNTSQNLMISWLSTNNTVYRNILGKNGTNYSCIRGYQLKGTNNLVYDNIGFLAKSMILNDAGYTGVVDGGNSFPIDPKFDFLGVGGFRPTNPAAVGYGRYASETLP